jgi:hypothetical protein
MLEFSTPSNQKYSFANVDVSRHILVVDTSVLAKSNMGRREYQFFFFTRPIEEKPCGILIKKKMCDTHCSTWGSNSGCLGGATALSPLGYEPINEYQNFNLSPCAQFD